MTKYIMHSDSKSKSKYKGGFIKGKNTKEYNHDYYIHNKEKWKNNVMSTIQAVADTAARTYHNIKDAFRNQKPKVVTKGAGAHKYVYRIKNGNRYRYFYSEKEYQSFLEGVKKKEGEWSTDEDMAVINPNKGENGYTLNCGSCCVAYDLRRRGYDVQSTKRYYVQTKDLESMYKGGKFQNYPPAKSNNAELLYNRVSRYGDGARGIVRVTWASGGGHVMNFEVQNGQMMILDCQTGKKYSKSLFSRIEKSIDWSSVQYMRTDNLEVTDAMKDFDMYIERGKTYGSKGRN